MPIGENVGRAYVSIFVDGDRVPDGIRDVLEDAEPSVREAGEEHGRTYGEAFDKEVKKSYKGQFGETQKQMFEDLNDRLTKSLAQLELSDRFFGSSKWKQFRQRLRDEAGAAGDLAGARLEKQFRDSANLEGLADQMASIGPLVRRAQRDMLTEMYDDAYRLNAEHDRNRLRQEAEYLAEAYAMNRIFDRRIRDLTIARDEEFERGHGRWLDSQRAMLDEAYQMNRDFTRRMNNLQAERDEGFERGAKRAQSAADSITNSLGRIRDELDEINAGGDSAFDIRALRRMTSELDRYIGSLGQNADSRYIETWRNDLRGLRRDLDDATPSLSRASRNIDRFSDIAGRGFGKGSRNDFLNLIGSMVGGIVRITKVIPEGISGISRFARSISSSFDLAGGGKSGLFAALKTGAEGFGGALLTVGKSAAGAGALVAFLVLAVGPIVGLLSGLTGIIVALAGSIAVGLVGALGALAGTMLPLAAIVGGVAAAFLTMDENQRKVLSNSLAPLREEATKFLDIFNRNVFANVEEQARRFGDAIGQNGRLARGLGTAISNVADNWLDMMNSDGFKNFRKSLETFLPNAVESLGNSIGNALGGVGGIFLALEPLTTRFLTWLEDVTGRFSDWANSTKGQQELVDFFDRAGDSAKALGGFLEDAGVWLANLLDAGSGTGNDIFKNMGEDFERWTQYLKDNPDAVQQWFGDAEELSHDVGDLVDSLNDLIDALDTVSTRAQGSGLVKTFSFILESMAITSDINEQLFSGVGQFLSIWGDGFKAMGDIIYDIVSGAWADAIIDGLADIDLSGVWDSIVEGFKSVFSGGNAGGALMIDPTQWINPADVAGLVTRVAGAFDALPGQIRSRLAGVPSAIRSAFGNLGGIGSSVVTALRSPFAGLPNSVRAAIAGVPGAVQSIFGRLPTVASTTVTNVVGFFRRMPSNIGAALAGVAGAVQGAFNAAVTAVQGIPGKIVDLFRGLAGSILSAIGTIDIGSLIKIPDPGKGVPYIPGLASGGSFGRITNGPMLRWVGEDGPEAIVPLDRDLSRVDPAVRHLSAIAQGLTNVPGMANGGVGGRSVDASGWTIVTPSENPRIVAAEVIDALVASTL